MCYHIFIIKKKSILERADLVLKQVKLICTEEGWLLMGKVKKSSGVMEIFCNLIWVAVTWVNIFVKINGIPRFTSVLSVVCR